MNTARPTASGIRHPETRAAVVDRLPGGALHFRAPGWEPQLFVRGEARVGKVFRPSGTEPFPCPRDVALAACQPGA